ncbi:hypothetical protein DYB32_000944 [Aphanomyces invadans]|uniref:Sfi1 spindle body domain-containing protein n=1 Tax=Aphanomyces invadans TaxID=157072 RepID=A0A418B8D4_9STRA|nr:hypothetical protein DYB32_000944 [Aphanomyces invadans]
MSRWRAAWDAEKRAHGKKLEELTKSHDEIKAKMGAKALECLMQRTTVFCFNRWKAFVATARETKGKVSHIVALLQSNKTALVFHRWKQHHELQQAQKQLTAKWHQIHATTLVKSAFNAWAATVAENRKLSSILELFGLTSARKTYESQWKAVADAISLAKRDQFKIQALDHATNAVQRKWNNIVCRQVIVWWRENAHANRRERDLLKRCALRLQHFAVGRVFEAWRENAWLQRRDRDARDIVLALCLRHVLSSTWARWRQFRLASAALERRQLEEAHRITQQALQDAKSTIESLTSQFQSTKAHASSLQDTTKQLKMQLQASKCMQFFQSTVRSAFFEWKRVAKLLQQTKGRVLVIVRRMQRMHHALVLDKWKAFVSTRHVKAHRAAAAQALHRKFIQLHTLHAWVEGIRRRIELRQKCQWIAHMMANTSIRCVWNEWRRFQQHQRHACNALVAITTALEVSAMRRLWQRWCDHHKAFIFHDEAQRKKAQQLLEFLSARASTSLRWYFDGWKQFLKRRRKKGTHDVLCKRWICQNVWRRWHHAIHQDRQLLRVLHQYERRILRKGWVQWQLGLVKLEIAWTKHTMEMERIQQHEQWEIERAQLTSTSVELEKQVQQHQSTIIAKDMTLEVFQTNIATMEAMHRESEACRSLYEDKFTTALHKLFETMSLQRIFRCVWKCAADMRSKWGMSTIIWRLRCAHIQKMAWGLQKWKHVAVQLAWRAKLQYTANQLDAAHQLLLDEQTAVLAQREDIVVPLRSTWLALNQTKTLEQLFDAVASTCFPDASGLLLLIDPLKQELWSMVSRQVVIAPAHLGIAGYVVGSGAAFRSAMVAQDKRFHPLVDQMAYLAHATDLFIVLEAVLHDILKSSKDPIAARCPTKLIKLYKQHKQWRKYYLDVEIRLRHTSDLYKQLQVTHVQRQHDFEQLLSTERDAAEATMVQLQARLSEKEKALRVQIESLEHQMGVDKCEWRAKEDELRQVIWTLQNQHQLARARDMISSARHVAVDTPCRHATDPTTHVLVAEMQSLQNQLTQAETDALFLSKAIRVAMKYQGKLPEVMVVEIKRIGRRLSDKKAGTSPGE